jgi:acyl transferase domain-containing protein
MRTRAGQPAAGAAAGAPVQQVGVYVGIQQMEYGGLAAPHLTSIGPYSATGGPFSVAAGRLSFTYGLKGPAVLILLYHMHLLMLSLPVLSGFVAGIG